MENNKDFLGTQPVGKLLFKLAIPTVIAQLINMLYNIVDRIFIGHIPDAGSLALTGVGVTMPIIMIVSAFAGLVSSGLDFCSILEQCVFSGMGDTSSGWPRWAGSSKNSEYTWRFSWLSLPTNVR